MKKLTEGKLCKNDTATQNEKQDQVYKATPPEKRRNKRYIDKTFNHMEQE